MHGAMWEQARKNGVMNPAGKVFPRPKPYSKDDPTEVVIDKMDWTPGVSRVAIFAVGWPTSRWDLDSIKFAKA